MRSMWRSAGLVVVLGVWALGQATQPETARVLEMGWLASPGEVTASGDPVVQKLIGQHNAGQDRIGHAVLRGKCQWMFGEEEAGKPREMSVEFDRATQKASVRCADNACTAQGAAVTIGSPRDANMGTDVLYVLMFRKYNPGEFKVVPPETPGPGNEGRTVLKAEDQTLVFESASGRLVAAEFEVPAGTVRMELGKAVEVGKEKVGVPETVTVMVPQGHYLFEAPEDGKICFTVDGGRSEIRGKSE